MEGNSKLGTREGLDIAKEAMLLHRSKKKIKQAEASFFWGTIENCGLQWQIATRHDNVQGNQPHSYKETLMREVNEDESVSIKEDHSN